MVNQHNAVNILNFVHEKSKLFLLLTFISFRKLLSRILFRVVAMVNFLQNFAREICARVTRSYAFAHARAFDRGETPSIVTPASRNKEASCCLATSGTKTAGSVPSQRRDVAINWYLFPRPFK